MFSVANENSDLLQRSRSDGLSPQAATRIALRLGHGTTQNIVRSLEKKIHGAVASACRVLRPLRRKLSLAGLQILAGYTAPCMGLA